MHFPQTSYPSLAAQHTGAAHMTGTQIVGMPQTQQHVQYMAAPTATTGALQSQQPQQQIISSAALTPQVLQQLQQHLCAQNVMTQPTTQYVISTPGATTAATALTAIPQGYQTVQTVGGQQVLIQTNAVNQQMTNGMTVQSAPANGNQLVQLVLSNGQVITTTLANLQAMGVTAPTPTPQQYSTQYQTNGNIIVTGAQPTAQSIPLQTQLVTNSAGQVPQSTLTQENTSHSIDNNSEIISTDKVSVQSQTSSPSSSSNNTMEAESTTQCNLPNKDTISNTDANIVDGINLEEIKDFAKAFKIRRLSLGLTQTQVGQALSATEGPSYSQSAICRFEKLDITPKSAQKIKPVLENWMKEAEERYKNGNQTLTEFMGSESSKKRKRRTSFTPTALEFLNLFFEKNTHPTGSEMTELSEQLNYEREVVRVWFCNKRQALRNTNKKFETNTTYHQIV
ncbi:unnamed protein product [Oppiella nova]|uniref:POU domain protein n=2 Tax=Oppiella nova TaxID=334625 RepID=A0A7R9LUT3_9ACAR|nr:unnamed protein product [Oppiella nova]CAG2166519.1 unnamed protein product [Oppiella nova]